MQVVGFLGKKRSGKDTSVTMWTEYLVQNGYDVYLIRFAEPLKQLLAKMTGQSYKFYDDDETKEKPIEVEVLNTISRKMENFRAIDWSKTRLLSPLLAKNAEKSIDESFEMFKSMFNKRMEDNQVVSPRWMLQTLGTDCLRDHTDKGIWTTLMDIKLNRMPKVNKTIVLIPDVRFKTEVALLEGSWNAHFIRVIRPALKTTEFSNHSSETELDDLEIAINVINEENAWELLKERQIEVAKKLIM